MVKGIHPYELVGEKITVIGSSNKTHLGIAGKIIDETKETITIEHEGKTKVLLKKIIKFKILRTGEVIIGEEITKRPEDRLKGK